MCKCVNQALVPCSMDGTKAHLNSAYTLNREPLLCCRLYHRWDSTERLKEEEVRGERALNHWQLIHCRQVISPSSQVLGNMNPFWAGVLERHNNGNISFSPCTASGLSAVAPTDICFLWQRCVAQPQQQTAGCPLHTHDLQGSQKTTITKIIPAWITTLKNFTIHTSAHKTPFKT